MKPRTVSESTLSALVEQLADEELEILAWIAARLLAGQKTYGKVNLEKDSRDFLHERAEELADAIVYTAMDAIRRDCRR